MSDAEQPEGPPSPSARSPTKPRISALFTPDRITAAFTVVLALATLALGELDQREAGRPCYALHHETAN
jgi:hypothetical protein